MVIVVGYVVDWNYRDRWGRGGKRGKHECCEDGLKKERWNAERGAEGTRRATVISRSTVTSVLTLWNGDDGVL